MDLEEAIELERGGVLQQSTATEDNEIVSRNCGSNLRKGAQQQLTLDKLELARHIAALSNRGNGIVKVVPQRNVEEWTVQSRNVWVQSRVLLK